MSTKTLRKRIALVAVSALGFGVLSVAPSQAAAITNTTTAATAGTLAQTASVGSSASTTIGFTHAGTALTLAGLDTATFTSTTVALTVPTASTVTLADNNGAIAGTTAAFATTGGTAGLAAAVNTSTGAITSGAVTADVALGAIVAGTISITPDVVGEYTITVTAGGAGSGSATAVAKIYAYSQASNGATVVGLVGDGGAVTANSNAVNGVAGPANTVQVRVFPSTTSNVRTLVVVEGSSASIVSSSGGTVVLAAGTNPTTATVAHQATPVTASDFTIATPTVGTATVKIYRETAASSGIFSATASGTVTINVAATRSAGTVSVTNSTEYASTTLGSAADATTDAAMTSVVGTGTPAVRVRFTVDVLDTLGARMAASTTSLTASVAGPGLLSSTNATTSTSRVLVVNWAGNAVSDFYLASDGTSGTSTITISWGSTVLATKTVTFYGDVAVIVAAVNTTVLSTDPVSNVTVIVLPD
jgi:hypothetical protein